MFRQKGGKTEKYNTIHIQPANKERKEWKKKNTQQTNTEWNLILDLLTYCDWHHIIDSNCTRKICLDTSVICIDWHIPVVYRLIFVYDLPLRLLLCFRFANSIAGSLSARVCTIYIVLIARSLVAKMLIAFRIRRGTQIEKKLLAVWPNFSVFVFFLIVRHILSLSKSVLSHREKASHERMFIFIKNFFFQLNWMPPFHLKVFSRIILFKSKIIAVFFLSLHLCFILSIPRNYLWKRPLFISCLSIVFVLIVHIVA